MAPLLLEPPFRADAAGVVRIGATRVSLDVLVVAYHAGATPEEIVLRFPTLDLADVYAAIAFCLRHEPEIEDYMAAREGEATANRARAEAIEPMAAVRERLLARRRLAS